MKIETAKMMFSAGAIKTAVVIEFDQFDEHYWYITFYMNTTVPPETLQAARGGARQFKTLEAATKMLREIGFRSFSVDLQK